MLNLNWQYSTAVGRAGGMLINGWKGTLLKDWTFTNTISVGSGLPLTPVIGGVRSTTTGTGITGSLRANATGLPVDDGAAGQPFNFAGLCAARSRTMGQRRPQYHHRTHPVQPQRVRSAASSASASAEHRSALRRGRTRSTT